MLPLCKTGLGEQERVKKVSGERMNKEKERNLRSRKGREREKENAREEKEKERGRERERTHKKLWLVMNTWDGSLNHVFLCLPGIS